MGYCFRMKEKFVAIELILTTHHAETRSFI